MKLPTLRRKPDPRDHSEPAATPPATPTAIATRKGVAEHAGYGDWYACPVCGNTINTDVCGVDGNRRSA